MATKMDSMQMQQDGERQKDDLVVPSAKDSCDVAVSINIPEVNNLLSNYISVSIGPKI